MASSPSVPSPYLSVVAASRNDDHGGDPLVRTQIFINTFARQCEQYRLPAELILVDWNPVPGRPGLAGVLQLPAEASFCQARVITVPAVLHDRFKYSERLPFFQMIAKNAGIRRARGRFVLATNIDIIFSDELMRHLAGQQLDPSRLYRVDRYDIHSGLSLSQSPDEVLNYAWTHPVRSNHRFHPRLLVEHLYGDEPFRRYCQPDPAICEGLKGFSLVEEAEVWSIRVKRDTPIEQLHTNACGDFTLLSKQGWDTITGYPEFEAFSMNIDSVGMAAAHYAGFEETSLLPPCVCFHIEHNLGSGWTPEGEQKLFARLKNARILNPEWHVLTPLVESMRSGERPAALNGPGWGLAAHALPEEPLMPGGNGPTDPHPRDYRPAAGMTVGALLPEFDLDRLSLWQERDQNPIDRLTQMLEECRAKLRQAEAYVVQIDKDRANRLAALEEYGANTKKMEAYILSIERDRDERLASIKFHQEKLQKAYADHAHNVAYIGKLHAEIEAHVKVAAEHKAIIARLNEQLRAATEGRPAGA